MQIGDRVRIMEEESANRNVIVTVLDIEPDHEDTKWDEFYLQFDNGNTTVLCRCEIEPI